MKYVLTFVFLLLMSGILRAEQITLMPKPVPAPTSPRVVMDLEQNESLSSKSAKGELKDLVAEVKEYKNFVVYIIFYEKRARSREALRMANQIKNYLVKQEAMESDRIILVKGSNNNNWKIRIYLIQPEKTVEDSNGQTFNTSEFLNYRTERISNITLGGYSNQDINCLKNALYETLK